LFDSGFGLSLSDKGIQGQVKPNCLATVVVASQVQPLDELIARVSSWLKLVYIVANVKRFIQGTQNSSCDKASKTYIWKYKGSKEYLYKTRSSLLPRGL